MKWFIGIMGFLVLIAFIGIVSVDKIMIREDREPAYHEKWERIRKRWSPKITFFENLLGWIFAILVIYFIYLG